MAAQTQGITFLVPGQPAQAGQLPTRGQLPTQAAAELKGTVKAAVRVSARRGAADVVPVTAQPGEDVVVIRIANGPVLYLHPENARELMRAQVGAVQPTARGVGEPPLGGDVLVPAQLSWRGLDSPAATRGGVLAGIGEAFIDAIEVVTGLFKDKAVKMVAAAATKQLDGQVDPGVYQLSQDQLPQLKGSGQKLAKVPAAPGDGPILVLAHGTFVETSSTFGKLWTAHPTLVRALFERYGGRVYALDHPTVGASPFTNAITLAETLPKDARLHLVTHSRGGLVAEVLARIAGGQGLRPEDFALFKGDAYGQHRADLGKLGTLVKQQSFRVERMVRVACPARGTLLASRRLDAYLSVLKWGLELAGVPVVPELVDFLAEIARRRTDPSELPGLEAMMPGRPVAEWLNASADAVPGGLRVVAGDIEGDSLLSWLKTLLADAFYWADNDLVVQTRSMYGGTPRENGGATFLLDRGGKVTHFNYFANERTAKAVANALLQDQPAEFQPIGPLSWAGEDASGTRAARAAIRSRAGNANERPAVFVLPGILGSNLKVDGKRVWLSLRFFNNLDELKWDPKTASRVQPDGPVSMSYDDFIDYLADSHEVVPFSFDWRRPIEDEAQRLADAIDASLVARNATQQPVRIVAHSMGGLVVRAMQLERPETWTRMMVRSGARVLMLGTPNGGSWAPMEVLSGDDTFGNTLTAFGSLFDGHHARQTIAEMPGLMQLQAALLDPSLGLDHAAGWQRLADADLRSVKERVDQQTWWHKDLLQLEPHKWGVPPQSVLDRAVALRRRLDAQREKLVPDASKLLLVVGKAPLTPSGVRVTEGGIEYLNAVDHGDGRVTLEGARLPGVRTWKANAAHGDLANARDAFEGYVELLTRAATSKLEELAEAEIAVRGGRITVAAPAVLVPGRPSRMLRAAQPPSTERDIFAPATERAAPPKVGAPLRISVVNGNLRFVRQPLILGHYVALKLTGSEAATDRLLDGAMSRSLGAGLYPSAIGSHQVFINTRRNPNDPLVLPRPEAVVVAGLGEEGTLSTADLGVAVRQAALAYAQRLSEQEAGRPAAFELATTLIGTGGIGVHVGTAAQTIAEAISQVNERVKSSGEPLTSSRWPEVAGLLIIEQYLDRATEAYNALKALATTHPGRFDLAPQVETALGALPRPPRSGYREAGYDFISVQRHDQASGPVIEFTLDTQRARSEVRGQATQLRLIDELVRVGADDRNRNTQIGRSLFKLLIPIELEPFMSDSSGILLQLDQTTAAYPWELLDTQRDEADPHDDMRPWAVRTRMLRKLRVSDFRNRPIDARRDAAVLVIGEPYSEYPPLPAAADEARAVGDVLGTDPRLKLDALAVVNAAFERSYKLIHIAGHGVYRKDGTGGVVLSNGAVFGPREVKAMRTVPELAFINCCYLGRIEGDSTVKASTLGEKRPLFAASVAEQLIRIGVRCVVAAGWAVDDVPAKLFAIRFYRELMVGSTFAEAVGRAREETQQSHPDSNTWAAYQCYGDPDWTYKVLRSADGRRTAEPSAIVSPADLEVELRTLAIRSAYDEDAERHDVRTHLEELEAAHAGRWGSCGAAAEAFGAAYAEVGDFDNAVRWYERAVSAEDGLASLRASAQLANLHARRGATAKNAAQGRREIRLAIGLLQSIMAIGPTSERASLLGSAFKRLAILERNSGRTAAFRKAVAEMEAHYREAEKRARQNNTDDLYYPASNRMSAELILNLGRSSWPGFDPVDVAAVRQSLQKKGTSDPNFWSVIGPTELRVYEALAGRELAEALDGILRDLADLKSRASAPRMWATVRDQAEFVLSSYIAARGLPAGEREAALKLLRELRDYATK